MLRALFLYNPISGQRRNTREREVSAAAEVFRAAGWETEIEPTRARDSAPQQARAGVERGCNAVIACGGDGTVHQILQAMVDTGAALGVLPLGTGNALANDLRLPRDPVRAARMLVAADTQTLRLPRMEFSNAVSGVAERSRYFLVGAGMGADAYLVYRLTLAFKSRWGMAAYYGEAWRQWFTYAYPLFEVEFVADGQRRREFVSQVLAIRVEWFGGFLRRLVPGASLHRDDLRLLLVKSRRRWPYLRYMAGVQLNRAWLGRDTELVYATELTCRALPDAPSRIYAEADGELLSTLPVSISMTSSTVKLLVPQKTSGAST